MTTGDQPDREEAAEPPAAADTTPEKGISMEIHPPHAIRTLKDFLLALLIVFIGILLALGLEGLITWGHNRALVREARANIATEIRNNKESLDKALHELPGRKDGLEKIIRTMRDMEAGKPGPKDLNYIFVGYNLYATAWQTAADSGATAHMGYDELKQYTELYSLQQIFMNVQFDAFRATADISDVRWVLDRDPKTVSKARLEEIETAAARYMTILDALTATGEQLSKKYEAFAQR